MNKEFSDKTMKYGGAGLLVGGCVLLGTMLVNPDLKTDFLRASTLFGITGGVAVLRVREIIRGRAHNSGNCGCAPG